VGAGELGFVHTIRANTHDQSPPPAAYIPTSGGLFRDCSIHDFDIIRFVTGREVATVFATGANKGAEFFAEGGDVDTAAALLTLDDDTLVSVTATRYNGGGHDVRMEVMGSAGTIGVGFDDSLALRSAEPGVDYPKGPQKWSYMERFLPAYQAELAAFTEVVAGAPSPCTVRDALAAFRVAEACERSRSKAQLVDLTEIGGGDTTPRNRSLRSRFREDPA
jgi:myo-inositol 2-dehydrogenase / D-chiro-inositol 1-dehydrogenase